jgi:hypothetical protein
VALAGGDKRVADVEARMVGQHHLLGKTRAAVDHDGADQVHRGGDGQRAADGHDVENERIFGAGDAEQGRVFVEEFQFVVGNGAAGFDHDKLDRLGALQQQPAEGRLLGIDQEFEGLVFGKTNQALREGEGRERALGGRGGQGVGSDFHGCRE